MAGSREPVPARFAGVYGGYARGLEQADGLDADTCRAYDSRVRSYLTWLASADTAGLDPLEDPEGRDHAAQAYLSYLKTGRHLAPGTVRNHLTALDHFYGHLGLGPPRLQRDQAPQRADPAILDAGQQIRYLRAAGQRPSRDRAIFLLLLHSGVRAGELVALDVGDVQMSPGGYQVTVREGDCRTVPVADEAAYAAMAQWIAERAGWPGVQATPALFPTRRSGRLSTRAVRKLVGALARAAGLTGQDGGPAASVQTVRATFGANQLRGSAGTLTVTRLLEVRDLMGYRTMETTLRLAGKGAGGGQ